MSKELKEELKGKAADEGLEFFGVVDAAELAKVPFPGHRLLDTPYGYMPDAKSVIIVGMHVWDEMFNTVLTSVIPDGYIPFDDVPGSQYYNLYYELLESRAHRVAHAIRDAGYKARAEHFIHAKAAATLAGLGWIGKQTLCITPQLGPRQRWCAVITDAALPPDEPFKQDLCGDCELCVEACPVNAIVPGPAQGVEPGNKVDFWKCIVPQEMLAEPNKAWQKYARKYGPRCVTECLICHDACPIGREEHERRVKEYSTKPPS